MGEIKPFPEPIYITRPLLPDLKKYCQRLSEVWDVKWLTNGGSQEQRLEERLRNLLRVPQLSLFNNGTIALIVACQALRLSGEVITTPFTFPATPHVLAWNGIKPIFCDIDPKTMNISAGQIESLITPRTTGILAVHVFGTPCDVHGIQAIADRYKLKVIYDAAHAFQAEIGGVSIGNFGDVSMFSFHATKVFHTAEGGALVCRDRGLKERFDFLKNFGIKNEDEVVMPGINGKMNELQAALGLAVLDCLDDEWRKRERLRQIYRECLREVEGVAFLEDNSNTKSSHQYFVIRINKEKFGKSRDEVYQAYKKYNVFTRKYFYPLCSDYACYRQYQTSEPSRLPVARQVVQETLSMPLYGALTEEDIVKICEILKSFQRNRQAHR